MCEQLFEVPWDGLRHLHRCSHLLQLVDDLFQLHAVVAKTLLPEISFTHGIRLMSLNPFTYAVLGTAIHEILLILTELIVFMYCSPPGDRSANNFWMAAMSSLSSTL